VPLAKRRVLVVDDTRAAAFMLGRLLETLGQDVSVCYDADTAMRIALEDVPDIIFSDLSMPHISGFQFAEQLRADELFQGTKLVALSGLDQEEDRRLAYQAGFDHHMVKPVSVQALRLLLAS
jgi:CheY-like chemotaxis protein